MLLEEDKAQEVEVAAPVSLNSVDIGNIMAEEALANLQKMKS